MCDDIHEGLIHDPTVSRRTCIIIVELNDGDERQDLGVIVDAVNEVLEIPRAEIEPPPTFGAKIRADFIQGMGKVEGHFVIILNVDRVLSPQEITMLASMSSNGNGTEEE